ncbi:hypothetical protein A3F28_03885 [Candidatus Uhrbacteria bacterium RIFCSPHIGHO2_12_FULL_57_11]|uniref:Phosphoribosyl-ATP pyrophosphohydrolase n=2 Tax=Candidatus Uhriibacteriota TaxID=1752732 RepID=A0A1F7ULS8_9BACT|nr:MAG: hypothetical protein A3D72_00060 [Candidatus Uhrbacteria bacterium RIFCSPHIGHO2_02_FULL_57_19]OGL78668.1 MAG: hypothetical protein A3F28_03885 [Candidatus Uhrbacteria bacterium RIFCSPHIGHO2_12_FULL_57_11]
MTKTPYNKLIRDKIPEVLARQDKAAETSVLDVPEYKRRLLLKLVEEAQELAHAGSEKFVDELADVKEVCRAILIAFGISEEDLERVRIAKRAERGGFDKRLLLTAVTEPDA